MRASALVIAGCLAGAARVVQAAPPGETTPSGTTSSAPSTRSADDGPRASVEPAPRARLHIATLLVRAPTELETPLLDALQLRLPDVDLRRHGDAPPPSSDEHGDPIPYAFVGVGARHETSVTMIVITSDGAAWSREVAIDDDPATSIARELTVLLASIEAGELTPERTDVAIPPPEDTPTPPREPAEATNPPSTDRTNEANQHSSPTAPKETTRAKLRIGATLTPSLAIALPPGTYADAFAGGGGSLAIDLRLRRRLALTLDVRSLVDARAPLTVLRTRVALGAGASFVRRVLHVDVLGLASIEPFAVRGGGERLDLETDDGGTVASPLLGGLVRVDLTGAVFDRGNTTVLLGPRLEVGASVSPSGNVPALADPRGAAFRPGGLELGLGVVLRVLVGVPAPRSGSGAQPRPGRRR